MRALPIVTYRRRYWFLDERLRELRDISRPWRSVPLNDFEIEYIKSHGRLDRDPP